MQQSIPEGKTMLARVRDPFLFDFKRNKIFIADEPGLSSPPPGIPFFKGPEALADYFLSKSIRYIAYSYTYPPGFHTRNLLDSPHHILIRTQIKHTVDFQDNLDKLGNTRKRIYDDGEIFVLDLLKKK